MTLYGIQSAPPLSLLSYALRREAGLTALPELARSSRGKPYFPHRPDLQFSWSHSGPYLLLTLSRFPVGVDIEVIRPRRESLPGHALTEEEKMEYHALGSDWPAFFTLWTRKEAWCKYTGEGLAMALRQTPPKDGLHYGFYAGEDWRACVCGEEPPPSHIIWLDREALT